MHVMSVSMVMIINAHGTVKNSNGLDPAVCRATPGIEGPLLPAVRRVIERSMSREKHCIWHKQVL